MEDFENLAAAPKSILGKTLVLLHWSGVTERTRVSTKEHAAMAYRNGYTRYKIVAEDEAA